MSHISAKEVKRKRTKIKNEFPDFKFSITKVKNIGIRVLILTAPFNMIVREHICKYEIVNSYYIENMYKNYPQIMNILLRIKNIIYEGHDDIVDYLYIGIGEYNTPFTIKEKPKKQKNIDKIR